MGGESWQEQTLHLPQLDFFSGIKAVLFFAISGLMAVDNFDVIPFI